MSAARSRKGPVAMPWPMANIYKTGGNALLWWWHEANAKTMVVARGECENSGGPKPGGNASADGPFNCMTVGNALLDGSPNYTTGGNAMYDAKCSANAANCIVLQLHSAVFALHCMASSCKILPLQGLQEWRELGGSVTRGRSARRGEWAPSPVAIN